MLRIALVALMLIPLAAAAEGTGQGRPPMTKEDFKALEPGFKALDTLASLKKSSDARRAACMRAFGHEPFCNCLNGRLALDLDFDDYVVLVTKTREDPGYLSLPADKQGLADDAVSVRDHCARTTVHH